MTTEQLKILVTVIVALISGISTIIVELVKANTAKIQRRESNKEIIVPEGYKLHTAQRRTIPSTIWIIAFTFIGGIVGYFIAPSLINFTTQVPTVAPTPVAAITQTPAPENILILIADFEDRSNGAFAGVDEGERIYNLIKEKIPSENKSIQLERSEQYFRDSESARNFLYSRNATILVWGWYDSVGINLVLENNIVKISDNINKNIYNETQTNPNTVLPAQTTRDEFILASPDSFVYSFAEQIPARSAYITFLTLGLFNFGTCKSPESITYLNLAVQSADNLSNKVPVVWDAYLLLGEAYRCQSLYNLSIDAYTKSLEAKPTPEAFFGRGIAKSYQVLELGGDTCGITNDINGALTDLEEAIKLNPRYAEAYWAIGWLKNKQGQYQEALVFLNKSIELNPILARAYLNRGISYAGLGENEKALAEYTKTIELGYHRPSIAYQNAAITYLDMSAYENALTNINTAIELEPDHYYLHAVRGEIYLKQNDLIKAEENYKKTVELNPKWGNYWLASYYYNIENFTYAIETMNQAIEIDPNCSEFYRRRAHYYLWGLEDYQAALSDANKALELNPELADGYNIRGVVYLNQSKYTDAITDFDKALILKRADYIYCNLGIAYSRRGETSTAIEYLIQGVELDYDNSMPWCSDLLNELR